MFTLHERLVADSTQIGELPLCTLLLINDANYPWLVLVPRRPEIREIYQLETADRVQLLEESCVLSEVMDAVFTPLKMNVAALGNMVPQLHLHHIARFSDDPAWPNPVWGAVPAKAYGDEIQQKLIFSIVERFNNTDLRLET
ncbi:HIT family protein [gamma proteobacterium IMCC1989]|nr:HIT family protein [gamma proteobacterium IMCC1989]